MKKEAREIFTMAGVVGLCLLLVPASALCQAKDPDYPTRPVTCYIAFAPGGTIDTTARVFLQAASKHMGQPFIPVNKAGAGGTLTAMAVLTAKPDGYTLGTVVASNAFVAPFSDESPYKDLSGFTMIVNYGFFVYPLLVRGDAPWKTWQEFVEWARKNPRAAKIGITGAKSVASQGLVLGQIEKKEQVEFTYVAFKGSSEVLSALLGGHITMESTATDPPMMGYLSEGKIRNLSYLSIQKLPGYENIPSLHDLYGISIPNIVGIFGPKGLPEYVLNKLDEAFVKALKDPDFINVMQRMYTPIVYMNRAQMHKYVQETLPKVGEIMKMLKAEEAKEKK
jgi:tripartite-type tricarboxylate transporter receptor subunit TctC